MKPEPDEGALAHICQLLVVGQFPIIAYFIYRWWRQSPFQALRVLAAQAFALSAALVPVYTLGL
jgi:hypothetical protein